MKVPSTMLPIIGLSLLKKRRFEGGLNSMLERRAKNRPRIQR